jgi:hypothetical protein
MVVPKKTQYPVHPLLENLKPLGPPPDSPVELSGYIGPASGPGKVRLYHSLQDLSHYIEFDESSVMFTAPAPKNIAPNNGLTVWVQASTPIRWTREYKSATRLANKIARMPFEGSQPPGIP